MDNYIEELEAAHIEELEAYLIAAGLSDYQLTEKDYLILEHFKNIEFSGFPVTELFSVCNTGNILSRDIIENSGDVPYLCASRDNNSVSSYIAYDDSLLEKGNCIFIGGKTFVVTYQERDFFQTTVIICDSMLTMRMEGQSLLIWALFHVFIGLFHINIHGGIVLVIEKLRTMLFGCQ